MVVSGGLSLCSRHLADLIFHSDSVKVGWSRLLPDQRSVYNRVTVQLRLIICQLQLRPRQLKIPKKLKTTSFGDWIQHESYAKQCHRNNPLFELIACHSSILWRSELNSVLLHNGHQKVLAICSHMKGSIFSSLISSRLSRTCYTSHPFLPFQFPSDK